MPFRDGAHSARAMHVRYAYICYGPYQKPGSINAARAVLILTGGAGSINTDRAVLMQLTFLLTAILKLGPYQNYQLQYVNGTCYALLQVNTYLACPSILNARVQPQ